MVAIRMPKLSPTMETGILSSWLIKVGQQVKIGDIIGEIETDKAMMEIEALANGTIGYLSNIVNQETPVNNVIGYILSEGEVAPNSWEAEITKANGQKINNEAGEIIKENIMQNQEKKSENSAQSSAKAISPKPISPLAKKIAAQKNIDITNIIGSGPNGRVIKADVEKADTEKVGTENMQILTMQNDASFEVEMTNMRKIIAKRLTQAKQEIPHIYLEKKICMDQVENMKNSLFQNFDLKISLTPFFIKAIALALKENPVLNRSFENDKIIQHVRCNINIAIAVENGLVTPIIFDADKKGINLIAKELANLAQLAKDNKLRLEQMIGGTFSISNLGMFSLDSFQAILNPPQVGILAIAATGTDAVFDGKNFIPRRMVKCTLSCDHRVVDGIDGAKFLNSFAKYIETPEGMVI